MTMNFLHQEHCFVYIPLIRTVVKLRAAPYGPSLAADIVSYHFHVIVSARHCQPTVWCGPKRTR